MIYDSPGGSTDQRFRLLSNYFGPCYYNYCVTVRVCVRVVTAPCTLWWTCDRRAGSALNQPPAAAAAAVRGCGRPTWRRASTYAPNVSRRQWARRSAAAVRAQVCRTVRRTGWRSVLPAAMERGWWRRGRNSASVVVVITSTTSSSSSSLPPSRHARFRSLIQQSVK